MAVTRSMAQRAAVRFPGNDGGSQRNSTQELKANYAALLIVFCMILIPIWIVKYPGMMDYPNHLARCYVLAHYHDNPVWQQRYELDHSPLPNLAIDLVVVPLLQLFP